MKKLAAHWQILIALFLATGIAIAFRQMNLNVSDESATSRFIANTVTVTDFIGKLFIRALQMVIVPLVVSSLIAGIAGLGS